MRMISSFPLFELPPIVWMTAGFATGLAIEGAWHPPIAAAVAVLFAAGILLAAARSLDSAALNALILLLLLAAAGGVYAELYEGFRPSWPGDADGRVLIVRGLLRTPPE